MTHLLRIAALVLLLPTIASADVKWKGDFETGNISQWTRSQSVANSRLQVVTDVVREGRYALKATVRQGDDPIGASGNRNELLHLTQEKSGSTWFYKWSTMFPKNYPSSDTWQVVVQWHQEGCCGSPPLEFFVRGEQLNLRVGGADGDIVWQSPLNRGEWHDFVLQVKWSSNAKTGFVQLWHNGKLALPKTFGATQYGKEMNYLKLGLYRDDSIRPEAFVYHDGFTMADKLEDVMPPPPAPVEEPAPTTPPVVATPEPSPAEPEVPGAEEPEAPEEEAPVLGHQPTPGVMPGDEAPGAQDNGSRMPGTAPQGCGASATGTGGVPLVAAGGLLAIAALLRRRRKPAVVLARSKQR
ncbi:carbohydrate-binding protein [Pyxidicoccus fallax]|uniref:Carbohydrate-binding protein n=1 Tax=Pyxidicoccus fallax TaxID=394095 RepID=A0A848LHA6_9BACT|nr:polysaccharide lyase [Pyxidicoccus fallax]NMO17373.1 carbohydrate-binding protein [Pyxidicoccus fallax]NPC84084.1 carbohydrate-binding protein [Pyxidicoccus fallax]